MNALKGGDEMRCNQHPQYEGHRPPRADCRICRLLYVKRHYAETDTNTLARKVGVSAGTVKNYASELGIKKGRKRAQLPPGEQVQEDLRSHKEHSKRVVTDRKYKLLLRDFQRLSKTHEALVDIQSAKPKVLDIKKYAGTVSESTAVVVASDWHIEERVRGSETNNLNTFDLAVAKKRVDDFFKVVLRLTEIEQQNTPIKTMVLALLGDFITGHIHEEMLETTSLAPVEAAVEALGFLQGGIDFLLKNSDLNLVVPCKVGNHSRITKKSRNATELGNSLELFIYKALQQRYENSERVSFIIEDSYHTYLKVYNMTLRFHHGHNIRYAGGVGGVTIPVNKAIAQWNKSRWADLDVFGHFHTFFDGGNFILNGSLIGYNAFAISIKASYERPTQAFFVINERLGGVIAVRRIYL